MSQSHIANPPNLGTLANLPPEIRYQIYALVFPISPTLSLASPDIQKDTSPSLYQHSIYRTHIIFKRATTAKDSHTYYTVSGAHFTSSCLILSPACMPPPATLANIQNIDICINIPEPYTHCTFDPWTHHTAGPGGFITDVLERIVLPMRNRKFCRLTFILGSTGELHPMHEPRMLDSLALSRGFKEVVLELRKRAWMGTYPLYFGSRWQAENDAEGMMLGMLMGYLGYGGGVEGAKGEEEGGRVKIVRSWLGRGDLEVLWDSML